MFNRVFKFTLIILALSAQADALTFSGLIEKADSKYYLKSHDTNEKFLMKFETAVVTSQFNRLVSGDFVAADVQISDKASELKVLSLHYVGLGALIGLWKGDDGSCYNFKSFTILYVYRPNPSGKCSVIISSKGEVKPRKLSYFVNPNLDEYLLLLSDEETEFVAELIFKTKNKAQINLFDSNSDGILSELILRR